MQLRMAVVSGALAVALAPAPARADGFVTPFIGGTFGGDTTVNSFSVGGAVGFMGGGVFGMELDFGYSPDFFGERSAIGNNSMTTLMANLIVGAPIGAVRPYGSGGLGLLKSRLEGPRALFDIDEKDFGINLGGGLMVFMTDNVGVRGDLRYFRNLTGEERRVHFALGDFDFWRGTFGLAVRF